MKLDQDLAILESAMLCSSLHDKQTIENALFTVSLLSLEQIAALSSFKQEEIERILYFYFSRR